MTSIMVNSNPEITQQAYVLQPVGKYTTSYNQGTLASFPLQQTIATDLRAEALGTKAWKENGEYKVQVPFQLFAKEITTQAPRQHVKWERNHLNSSFHTTMIDNNFNNPPIYGLNTVYLQNTNQVGNNYLLENGIEPIIEMNINQKLRVDYPNNNSNLNERNVRTMEMINWSTNIHESMNKLKKIELSNKLPDKKSTKINIKRKSSITSDHSEYDLTDYWKSSLPKTTPVNPSEEERKHITMLMEGAPLDSIRQTINVEREEEDIVGDEKNRPVPLLNFDTVSEKVDLCLQKGTAKLQVKVRCERVVPIDGKNNLYKKSSIIVTREIDIDLEVTGRRRNLLERIKRASHTDKVGRVKLSTTDTFKLYRIFMGMAEAGEELKNQKIAVEEEVDERTKKPKGLDHDIDLESVYSEDYGRYHRNDDTLSFQSAISSSKYKKDILY
ncbi:DgyrCDS2405 [Dimorphilus gyrociliatus]|uniref:DgyrCDS2405 n=1 Tax=Dimorphilus gyrociliatus TaxID=2664684 RepID=A0A7I8VDA0_9ANNE|nr:DgyrCDS2405 [Dimorphilus gyrociliatus]